MRRRPYDCLLIDFYGTIASGDREAVEYACQRIVETCELPIASPKFAVLWGERYFATVAASNHDAFRTLYECEVESLKQSLAEFGRSDDPAPFLVELEEYWHNPPIYADALELLRSLDLPVCCVSNADEKPLASAIARHRLRFDAAVSSESVRCYKPDALIFRRALERLGVRPERAIHVGDSLHSDIAGASNLGISTVWLRREDRIHDIGNHQPHRTITSLSELSAILS